MMAAMRDAEPREYLIMRPEVDNVSVVLRAFAGGESVAGVTLLSDVPRYHKVALSDIGADEPVYKYGHVIGYTTRAISAGSWVHTHNLHMGRLLEEEGTVPTPSPPESAEPLPDRFFLGFRRPDGRVGTRNYVLIAGTVDCSAKVVELAVEKLNERREWLSRRYPNVDGIVGLTHGSGCGLVALSPAHRRQNMTMRNLLQHPNVGGRVLVQLGCEKSQACLIIGEETLVPLHESEPATPGQTPLVTIQDHGGTWSTVEEIVRHVENVVLPAANKARRVLVPAEELVLAAQCGGSDAAGGFTSNAAIGQAFDLLVRCGGTAFISETTETLSAGHLLTRRARSKDVARAYVKHTAEYREYLEWGHGTPQNNLAHGNMVGGLTTVAEKALGSVAKAGSTALEWVCDYGERVPGRGLGFMNGPSFDPASATGQTAGGAQVGVFSTGRGSCFGGLLVPWIKVVSDSEAYERIEDMEINAGAIADGVASIEEMGRTIFETVLAAASGAKTYSEKAGYAVVNIWDSGAVT